MKICPSSRMRAGERMGGLVFPIPGFAVVRSTDRAKLTAGMV